MSTIYKCDRCGKEMNKIHRQIRDILMAVDYDLCDECFKDFKSFMFGPERDLDSKTPSYSGTLRPWSEVGPPPKINGYPLSDILSNARYKIDTYIRSDDDEGDIYKITDISLRDDGEIAYRVRDLSTNTYSTLSERIINNWYTLIVKYSCDGCKLEGTDDCMCDTCIVGDPKGPRRQWWKPKEEE